MITLRQHSDDKDMLEIRTPHPKGRTVVWGVVHEDFLYDAIPNQKTRIAIRSGEEIEFKLVVLKSK